MTKMINVEKSKLSGEKTETTSQVSVCVDAGSKAKFANGSRVADTPRCRITRSPVGSAVCTAAPCKTLSSQ